MRKPKYLWITIACALISVVGVFVGFNLSGTAGFGYGKFVAYFWHIFALLAFCFIWPLVIFVDFGIWRVRKLGSKTAKISSEGKVRLILATIMLCTSGGIVGKQLLGNHQEKVNLKLAKSSNIEPAWAVAFADEFMRATKNHGMLYDRNASAFSALLENPDTPPSLLLNMASRLDSSSAFWVPLFANPAVKGELYDQIFRAISLEGTAASFFAQDPNLDEEKLRVLATQSKSAPIRATIACNRSVPKYILETLAKDEDSEVRKWAEMRLKER